MTFSLVFDLWYPGNGAMTSSGDPSPVGYHPLPSCNTTLRACLPTTPLSLSLSLSLCVYMVCARVFHHHGHLPPGNPPRNSALQTGSDPSCAIAFVAITRGRKSRFPTRSETRYGFHPADRWISSLSTLSATRLAGKKTRVSLRRSSYVVPRTYADRAMKIQLNLDFWHVD